MTYLNKRNFNTNRVGAPFNSQIIHLVWQKGILIPGIDSSEYRKDRYGNIIKSSEYGNIKSDFGWEIDHIVPLARKGSDDLYNLQPLYWRNNRIKSDN